MRPAIHPTSFRAGRPLFLFYRFTPMLKSKSLIAAGLSLLLLSGCDRSDYVVEPVQAPSISTVNPPAAPTPETGKDKPADKSDKKDPGPPSEIPVLGKNFLLDGFEGPQATVWAFDSADDEGLAQYVTDGATQGKKALKITLRDKPVTGKMNLRRDVSLDLSHAAALLIDVNSSSDKLSFCAGLICGPHDISQESKVINLKKGANKDLRIPLTGNTWKNEKSKWEYTTPPVNLQFVQRLSILIFQNGEKEGALAFDNLRIEPDETPLLSSGSLVRREWRPELIAALGLPNSMHQYETLDALLFFRASYRDFFDSNDIACGIRIYAPSGKTIDARGFFMGLMPATRDLLKESDGEATPPLWGPAGEPDGLPTAQGGAQGGAKRKRKQDADKNPAAAPVEKDAPRDPVKEAEAQKKLLAAVDMRNATLNKAPVWSVRFSPAETGIYTLQIYIRNNAGETRTTERKLSVVAQNTHTAKAGTLGGNVRVSKRDPRQLELSNGDPFFIYGQNVCWTKNWTPYLDNMKAYGANTIRVWLCPWGLRLERKNAQEVFDLDEAERMDRLVSEAESRGLRLIFCFTFHGMNQSNWGDSPYNAANGGPCGRPEDFFTDWRAKRQFKRLLSYAAARWGASPAILSWELMNEIDLAKYTWPDDVIAWSREMAGHLKAVDPHGHLVTVSATSHGFPMELWNSPSIDWINIHSYGTDVSNLFFERLSPFQNIQKPVLLAEFGGGTEARDDIPDQDGARLQASLWLSACSPSCGCAMPWWWDTYIEARGLYPVLSAARKFSANDDRRGRFNLWVRKIYDGNIEVSGIMDAQGGRFYAHNPDWTKNPDLKKGPLMAADLLITLDGMNDGVYTLEFFDAKTGDTFKPQETVARDGKLPITLSAHAQEFGFKLEKKQRGAMGLK